MKKLMKFIVGLLLLVIGLVVAAVIIIPMVIEPNDFKPQIVEAVKKNTGRDLQIAGDIGLTVFPDLALDLGRTELGNAPGFDGASFASVESVSIQLALMPLLDKQVEVDEIVLDGLTLNLRRNKDGSNNWQDLAKKQQEKQETKTEAKPKDAGDRKIESLTIDGVRLRNAHVVWDDAQQGKRYEIKALNFSTGTLGSGDPVDFELETDLASNAPAMQGHVSMTATVQYMKTAANVSGLVFAYDLTGKALPGGKAKGQLKLATLDVDLEKQTLKISGLEGEVPGANFTGQLNGTQITSAKRLDGQIDLKISDTGAFASVIDAALPEGVGKGTPGRLQTAFLLDQGADTLQLKTLNGELLGLAFKATATGQTLSGESKFTGHVDISPFNPRQVMKTLGTEAPQTADAAVMKHAVINSNFVITKTSLALNKLQAKLDDTAINGRFAVSDFRSSAMNFNLDVDKINLDRYSPPPPPAAAKGAQKPAAGGKTAEPELFPVETLRKLNLNGELRIGHLVKNKLKANNVVIKVGAKQGNVHVNPTAQLYEGNYLGRIHVDARGNTPKLAVNTRLENVQIEPLLNDLTGEAKLAGRTTLTSNLTANGNRQSALKRTLNGNLGFSFVDGALVGVNIAKVIREGLAKFKGQPVPQSNEPERTDFSELKGTAKITNGVVDNRDLYMQSPLLRINGEGKANLVTEQLDYLVKATIVKSLKGQGGEGLEELSGLTIPVRVKGPFDKPSYKPDLAAALSEKAKARVKEKVDERKTEVKDKLKDKLKGLFDR